MTCPAHGKTVDDIVDWAIGACVEHGADFEAELPRGRTDYSAREVINACGRALAKVGVANNLEHPERPT